MATLLTTRANILIKWGVGKIDLQMGVEGFKLSAMILVVQYGGCWEMHILDIDERPATSVEG